MVTIDFFELEKFPEIEAIALKAAQLILDPESEEISIVFCDDQYIHDLNLEYRQVDRPTDVLSFSSDEIDPETGAHYLGDIVISYPRVLEQSANAGNSVLSEVAMLVIHGILHLRGFDHSNESEKKLMWTEQVKYLHSLGIEMDKFSGDE